MAKAQRRVSTGQDLRVAPADIRCEQYLEADDGSVEQCSRFTIKLPTGDRDSYCISHSSSRYAALLRSKGARAQRAAAEVSAELKAELAHALLPRVWRNLREVQRSRWRLVQATVRGDVTVAQAKVIRSIISDAEETGRTYRGSWQL